MSEYDSFLAEDDFDDFDDLLESPPPPFNEQDDDYPLKVLSHHVKGMFALISPSYPLHHMHISSDYPILRVLVAISHPQDRNASKFDRVLSRLRRAKQAVHY